MVMLIPPVLTCAPPGASIGPSYRRSHLDAAADRLAEGGHALIDLVQRDVQERHAQEAAAAVVAGEPLARATGHTVGRRPLAHLVPVHVGRELEPEVDATARHPEAHPRLAVLA